MSPTAKPFSYPELRARVQALLCRAESRRRPALLRVDNLEIDAAARVVRLRAAPVELSQKEFALVRSLASDPTRLFTKDDEGFGAGGAAVVVARPHRMLAINVPDLSSVASCDVSRRSSGSFKSCRTILRILDRVGSDGPTMEGWR
jgi:hypothetical protein